MAITTQKEFIEVIKFAKKPTTSTEQNNITFVRGKVVGFFANGEPKIQFAGETEAREKIYSRLSENVQLNDTVFLIQAFNSWLYLKDYTKNYEVNL